MNWIDVKELPKPKGNEKVIAVLADCGGKIYELAYITDSNKFYCDFPMKSYWEDWTEFVTVWAYKEPIHPAPTSQGDEGVDWGMALADAGKYVEENKKDSGLVGWHYGILEYLQQHFTITKKTA